MNHAKTRPVPHAMPHATLIKMAARISTGVRPLSMCGFGWGLGQRPASRLGGARANGRKRNDGCEDERKRLQHVVILAPGVVTTQRRGGGLVPARF